MLFFVCTCKEVDLKGSHFCLGVFLGMQARPFLEGQALAHAVRNSLIALASLLRDAEEVPALTVRFARELEPLLACFGATFEAAHNLAVAMVLVVAPRLIFDEFCLPARRIDLLLVQQQQHEERDAEGWTPCERAVFEEAHTLVRAYCDMDWDGMNDEAFAEAGRWWQRQNPTRSAVARTSVRAPPSPHVRAETHVREEL